MGRISRRRVLQGMAAGAGALAVGAGGRLAWSAPGVNWPETRPDPSRPEGIDTMPEVEHIVIYMQENHSYDSYFGMLPFGDGYTLGPDGRPTDSNPDGSGGSVGVFRADSGCQTGRGVSQSWDATHRQYDGGAMDGFYATSGLNAMKYWDDTLLPFYWDLARTFVLCDRWFASAPCQTYPNRRYLQAATSAGIVSTSLTAIESTQTAPNGTIWDRLNAHGISWLDYAYDLPEILLFPTTYNTYKDHVRTIPNFLADAAAGTLPRVSLVSPGFNSYTEENPHDVQLGEAFTARIVNAVMDGPGWEKTVMFFMYDEHGGYYDHVPPPAAIAPDSYAPQTTVPPDAPGGFDRYGMRVPGFVISPFAKPDHVSSTVYDHTSVLRFIETKYNLGAMTYRDANANDLVDTLDFKTVAFREPPTLAAPGLPASGSACEPGIKDPKTIRPVTGAPSPPPVPVTTTTVAKVPSSTTRPGSTTSTTSTTIVKGSTTTTTSSTVPRSTTTEPPITKQLAALQRKNDGPGDGFAGMIGATAVAAGFIALAAKYRGDGPADDGATDPASPSSA